MNLKGSDYGLSEVTNPSFSDSVTNHEISQPQYLVSEPSFETLTF
jgi:hypothetical protein